MSDIENVPSKYRDVQAALTDLAQLSRMLEITRTCAAQLQACSDDINRLVVKLIADRRTALDAIDAMTETAPRACGVDISPFVDQSGCAVQAEVSELERQAAAIIDLAWGQS